VEIIDFGQLIRDGTELQKSRVAEYANIFRKNCLAFIALSIKKVGKIMNPGFCQGKLV